MRAEPRTQDFYPEIDALAERGGHRTFIRHASENPRRYQGFCFQCDWHGSLGTGRHAELEMLDHTKSTLPQSR